MIIWRGSRRIEPWALKNSPDSVFVWYKKGSIVVDMAAEPTTAFEASILSKIR